MAWVENEFGMLANSGDFGGDIQTGPAFSRQFEDSETGMVVSFAVYTANEFGPDVSHAVSDFVQTQVWVCHCEDTDEPGMTEISSDYLYWDTYYDMTTPEDTCKAISLDDVYYALEQANL